MFDADLLGVMQKKSMKIWPAVLLLTAFICPVQSYEIKDFHQIWPWLYKSEGLYNVDIGIRSPEDTEGNKLFNGMTIIAIGDLDDNMHTDILTISEDRQTLTIHMFDDERMDYKSSSSINLGDCKVASATIIAAPPYRLAVVCTEKNDYEYIKLLQDVTEPLSVLSTDLDSHKLEKGSQPVFLDINSDSYIDFMYNTNSPTDDDNIKVVLFNYYKGKFEAKTLGFTDNYLIQGGLGGCKEYPGKYQIKLSKPHFTTLTDVNSDCIADLYLTVTTTNDSDLYGLTMIFTKFKTNDEEFMMYCLVDTEDLSLLNYTSPVFADFDNDATIDKAFYNNSTNAIVIYYNNLGSNSASSSDLCKSVPSISIKENSDEFTNMKVFSQETDTYKIEGAAGLFTHPDLQFIPGQIRTGDYDSDGKADILVTVKTDDQVSQTMILINKACNGDFGCTKRSFDKSSDYAKLTEYSNTAYTFAMDFDDNGRLDFIVVQKYDNGSTEILSFYNNYSRDSYFISASIYTHSSIAYGYKVNGAFCRGIYTSLTDSQNVFVAQQLTRTSYGALQDPVAMHAIGRSNNYIEDFTLSYHNQKINDADEKYSLSIERKSWTPIIPNSNLVIGVSTPSNSGWNIRLLINPTDSFLMVGIILTLILIIIGAIIIYIHLKEKKEDEESRNPQLDFF